tara:strand:+ start:198 stop:587 length:390 start_codon:yes stop_codon:yes gene_type:complete
MAEKALMPSSNYYPIPKSGTNKANLLTLWGYEVSDSIQEGADLVRHISINQVKLGELRYSQRGDGFPMVLYDLTNPKQIKAALGLRANLTRCDIRGGEDPPLREVISTLKQRASDTTTLVGELEQINRT